jgi:hypothetical protein
MEPFLSNMVYSLDEHMADKVQITPARTVTLAQGGATSTDKAAYKTDSDS